MRYEDGVHDISNEQYHAAEGFSRSQLMLFDKSPYHFWYDVLSGEAEQKPQTPAMAIGSAFHTMLLEPNRFDDEYMITPKFDRRTNKGKEEYDSFMSQHNGKVLLTEDQFVDINKMVELIKRHEIVKTLVEDSMIEKSIFWTDKETGLQFKTRPDLWSTKMVVDVKTTADCSPYAFTRSAMKYGYYLQAGMAYEAAKACGKPFEMFVVLCCEKDAPHVPAVYMMKDDAIQYGLDQFEKYKRLLAECLEKDKWDGYKVQELGVPSYVTNDGDEV